MLDNPALNTSGGVHSPLQNQPAENFGFDVQAARGELAAGLLRRKARIAPKYFYDSLGSKLFEAICGLDEYYLTRAETSIFNSCKTDIAASAGANTVLIDLGAGNCEKAARLFDVLKPSRYVPVDISTDFLHHAVEKLQHRHPGLPMQPLAMDFAESLQLPPAIQWRSNKLFFYPGSSLGNFSPPQASRFLKKIRAACGPEGGAILLGVDLVKDEPTLVAAYDDALGVTAAFNLNVLRHVNRILGTNFEVSGWRHSAFYNTQRHRIEMHLAARETTTVRWPEGVRTFVKDETIHTENSYKFTREGLTALLARCGFADPKCWTGADANFLVCYARSV